MSCCKNYVNDDGTQEEKRAVVLRFRRENLDYSIGNMAYVESHVMSEEAECRKHVVADILDEGNRDRVTRILGVIHAGVIEMLYPFTKIGAVEEEIVDDIWEPEEYLIEVHVPETFSRTSLHYLSRLIHEYMVYRVLSDWLSIAGDPNSASWRMWIEKASEIEGEIERLKSHRTGATLERKLRPW